MKKYWYLLMMTLCMGFVACGSDDSSDDGKVSGDAQKFVGGWYAEGDGYGYVFASDGTCMYDDYEKRYVGTWDYDNNTKQLITTMNGETWSVSMITDNAWTGLSMKEGKSITYRQDDRIYLAAFADLMENGHVGLGERGKGDYIYIYADDLSNKMKMITSTDKPSYDYYSLEASPENLSITASTIKVTDLTYDYWDEVSRTSINVFNGSMTLTNYGKENAKMIIEGTIVPTGEKFKGEYNANYYIKDGELVRINK